jgi:Icc-related predicted phosphoesterase
MMMKIKVVSDLHLETCENNQGVPDLGEGEVLILGGDILCARHFKKDGPLKKVYNDFLKRCVDNFDWVLYLTGNHEAYGYNYEGTWDVLKENLPEGIHLMENSVVKIQDWVFLGATLWTDFRNENALEMMEASQCMNDYKTIRIGSNYRKLNPDDTLKFHKKSKQFLLDTLPMFKNQKVWVLTHHAPSYQSVSTKYKSSGIANGAYVSNLDDLILDNPQVKYWSHGHTHESMDYMIGGCRVICNPRGYFPTEVNPDFDPNFEVDTSWPGTGEPQNPL